MISENINDPIQPIIPPVDEMPWITQGPFANTLNGVQDMLNQLSHSIAIHDAHVAGQLNLAIQDAVGKARDYLDLKLGTIIHIVDNIETTVGALDGLLNNSGDISKSDLDNMLSAIMSEVDNQASVTNSGLIGLSQATYNAASSIIDGITNETNLIISTTDDMLHGYTDELSSIISQVESSVKSSINDANIDISNKLGFIQQENYDNLNAVDADIRSALGEVSASMSTSIEGIPDKMVTSVGNFMEAVQWLWTQFLEWDATNKDISPEKMVQDYLTITNAHFNATKTLISE